MLKKITRNALGVLEEAWQVIHPLTVSLKKIETNPDFLHLYGDGEMVLVVSFSLKNDMVNGNIHFCMSYLMLDPIKDKLCSSYMREKDNESKWGHEIEGLIRDSELNITAQLGKESFSVRQILNFKKGDILRLTTGPKNDVTLTVNSIPKFTGTPGIYKGSRAVEITQVLNR